MTNSVGELVRKGLTVKYPRDFAKERKGFRRVPLCSNFASFAVRFFFQPTRVTNDRQNKYLVTLNYHTSIAGK